MAPLVPDKSSFDSPQPSNPASTPTPNNNNNHHNDPDCPFCRISQLYSPFDPLAPLPADSKALSPTLASPNPETYIILSTPSVIAFLDIMPLSRGHLLLCPRRHSPKLSDVDSHEARELGYYLRILSSALSRATGVDDWNVVQNNGAAAAQVVPHMHFHVIPRPEIRAQGRWSEKFTMFGRGQRSDLDPEDGDRLAEKVRREVGWVLRGQGEDKARPKL